MVEKILFGENVLVVGKMTPKNSYQTQISIRSLKCYEEVRCRRNKSEKWNTKRNLSVSNKNV